MGQLQSAVVINVHGAPPLRILLTANVVELEVRLPTDMFDFGCVRAGCCKVRYMFSACNLHPCPEWSCACQRHIS